MRSRECSAMIFLHLSLEQLSWPSNEQHTAATAATIHLSTALSVGLMPSRKPSGQSRDRMQSLPLNSADSESTRATLVGASIELVVRLSPAAQAVLNALTPDLGVASGPSAPSFGPNGI